MATRTGKTNTAKKKPAAKKKAAAKPRKDAAKTQAMEAALGPTAGKTRRQICADVAMSPTALAAFTAAAYATPTLKELDALDCAAVLNESIQRIKDGDMADVEAMLVAQATAMNTMFHEFARRAGMNMGEYPKATEMYLRFAFKAQSQCRTTLQTLGEIKNPRQVAFVKAGQANIANGHQQVNNGGAEAPRARENQTEQSKLLEEQHGERLDTRTTGAAGGAHSELEAVGEVHGTADN